MDIEKEKEAFEQHLTDTGLVEFSDYGFSVDECDEYLHEPTQVAWDSWLIGLNRAKAQAEKALLEQFEINNKLVEQVEKLKAQAVPDGFVVVPEEPTERMLDSAYSSISDNLHYADLENIYKAMIWSAQEPAND